MPKHIFKSSDHEILSTDGLIYTTAFGIVAQGATHIPSFRKPDNEDFYILVDKEYRTFQPSKTVFGLSYQQEDGSFSEPLTAIFCHIGGIEEECVVLGTFSQSHANDVFDSLSPYDDIPTGRWTFWEKYPKIFFYVRAGLEPVRENMLYLTPQMVPLRFNKDREGRIYGYGLNPETGDISSLPAIATCTWIPGQRIEQTLADHEGRPLERESGAAYSKLIPGKKKQ